MPPTMFLGKLSCVAFSFFAVFNIVNANPRSTRKKSIRLRCERASCSFSTSVSSCFFTPLYSPAGSTGVNRKAIQAVQANRGHSVRGQGNVRRADPRKCSHKSSLRTERKRKTPRQGDRIHILEDLTVHCLPQTSKH